VASTSVETELAVRDLVARYGDAVCRRDEAAWAATWATDCTWDLGGGRVARGRDETVRLWLATLEKYPWVAQLPSSGLVTEDDSGVHGSWYLLELNHRADGAGVMHLCHYTDDYVRGDSSWQFAARTLHVIYRGALDPGTVVLLPGSAAAG